MKIFFIRTSIAVGVFFIFGIILKILNITVILPCSLYGNKSNIDVNKPLENFDFQQGDWRAYLILDGKDKISDSASKCFVIKDRMQLEKMKNSWIFSDSHGDMATVTSYVIITKNRKIMFRSGITLDGSLGLQQEDLGWFEPIDAVKFRENIESFKEYKWPFLIL